MRFYLLNKTSNNQQIKHSHLNKPTYKLCCMCISLIKKDIYLNYLLVSVEHEKFL